MPARPGVSVGARRGARSWSRTVLSIGGVIGTPVPITLGHR